MRVTTLSITFLLSFSVFAAKKPDPERFAKFHGASLQTTPIKLNDKLYSELTTAPRDYSVAILLTALEARLGCALCQEFQSDWDMIAWSWRKGDKNGETRVLFGTLDFADGRQTFQNLMLQTAPILLLFNPTVGPGAKPDLQPSRHDFSNGPQSADVIHAWISRHLPDGPKPPLVRPVNYVKIISVVTGVLGLISLFTVAAPYAMPILQNRNLWAAVSIIAVLLFTSGHMFNHIRRVPYIAGDGKGGISYFAGGFQNQYGMETQIVAAMYGILSFAAISLALKVPRIADPMFQQTSVFIWSIVLVMLYSVLLSVFRIKNGGYPFWLPPF